MYRVLNYMVGRCFATLGCKDPCWLRWCSKSSSVSFYGLKLLNLYVHQTYSHILVLDLLCSAIVLKEFLYSSKPTSEAINSVRRLCFVISCVYEGLLVREKTRIRSWNTLLATWDRDVLNQHSVSETPWIAHSEAYVMYFLCLWCKVLYLEL